MSDLLQRVRSELARISGFTRRDAMAERFDEEARYHIELQVARNLAAGMTPDEARRAALVAFGGRERFGEAARDEVRSLALEELQRDVHFSLRSLRRAPAFAFAAILTLALGIGATTVIFSVTDHVVLRPLAYAHAKRVVLVREVIEQLQDRMPSLAANASHYSRGVDGAVYAKTSPHFVQWTSHCAATAIRSGWARRVRPRTCCRCSVHVRSSAVSSRKRRMSKARSAWRCSRTASGGASSVVGATSLDKRSILAACRRP